MCGGDGVGVVVGDGRNTMLNGLRSAKPDNKASPLVISISISIYIDIHIHISLYI